MNDPLIVFGEALVDCFPECLVPGGAPFNVARHPAGLGLPVLMITRIGRDPLAAIVRAEFERFGLSKRGLQEDEYAATGSVLIRACATNGHEFEILANQAYDGIDGAAAVAAATGIPTAPLYHGTLATRSQRAHEALSELYWPGDRGSFPDLNWRQGHVAVSRARELLVRGYAAFDRAGQCLAAGTAPVQSHVVDTVGAGDAFSAVMLAGRLRAWSLPISLERAAAFVSAICGQRGAVSPDANFYRGWRQQWALPC